MPVEFLFNPTNFPEIDAFLLGCYEGRLEPVQEWIQKRQFCVVKDADQRTALMLATLSSSQEVFHTVLQTTPEKTMWLRDSSKKTIFDYISHSPEELQEERKNCICTKIKSSDQFIELVKTLSHELPSEMVTLENGEFTPVTFTNQETMDFMMGFLDGAQEKKEQTAQHDTIDQSFLHNLAESFNKNRPSNLTNAMDRVQRQAGKSYSKASIVRFIQSCVRTYKWENSIVTQQECQEAFLHDKKRLIRIFKKMNPNITEAVEFVQKQYGYQHSRKGMRNFLLSL